MEKEKDYNEVVLSLEVDEGTIGRVISGETTHITMYISDDNYRLILQNDDGILLLDVDELPDTYYGCYYYNNGVFPYVIKDELDFVLLHHGEERLMTKIIGYKIEPHKRFRFQGPGKPGIDDPNGDSCIWAIHLELLPMKDDHRCYLLRWNPKISSFKESDFEKGVALAGNGAFRMNWSIYEWQEARRGDVFYMLRTGDDKAGIVFSGQFLSDPYPSDDWAGTNKRRMYVDMVVYNYVEPGEGPRIPLEKLQHAIPEFEWAKGHSGELLSVEVADKITELLDGNEPEPDDEEYVN